jgi:hypothetical protein
LAESKIYPKLNSFDGGVKPILDPGGKHMKKLLFIYFLAAISTANAADRWWEIRISGEPSGYQHMTTETLADGTIRTTNEQVTAIKRGILRV